MTEDAMTELARLRAENEALKAKAAGGGRAISMKVSDKDLKARRKLWKMPPYKATRGTLAKYIRLVKNASQGCVTDEE